MNMEDGPSLIWGIVALIMVGSSLLARRLPLGQTLKMALGWVAIFATLFVIFSFRPEIKTVWERVKSDMGGTANQKAVGNTVQITRGDDGHFSVRAMVNGTPVDFMIDSGATTTSLGSDAAAAASVIIDENGFPVILDTANGKTSAKRGMIKELRIDELALRDHAVVVSQSFGDINVLGMNFLDSLKSWKVEGRVMTLEPQ
jgi:aspartyl protease family protein